MDGYQISETGMSLLQQTKFLPLVAITSSGRNTLIRELIKTGEYHFIVSDTTRKPRINDGIEERNGVEYWFRSEAEVLADLKAGRYLEAAVIHNQQVSGISLREIERAAKDNKIAVTDMEVVGVDNIMQASPNIQPIFLLPPNYEEWQRRLKHRGFMTKQEFNNRMQSACLELNEALARNYYHFVVNDTLAHAVGRVHEIAVGKDTKKQRDIGRSIAESILKRLSQFIKIL